MQASSELLRCRANISPWQTRLNGRSFMVDNYHAGPAVAACVIGHRDLSSRGERRGNDGARASCDGLRERGHQLQLIRPRQDARHRRSGGDRPQRAGPDGTWRADSTLPPIETGSAFASELWFKSVDGTQRPDIVHLVTEGPLGWSALNAAAAAQAARRQRLSHQFPQPTASHYGVGWLHSAPIMAYLRKFHNRVGSTMVPTEVHAQWSCKPHGFQGPARGGSRGVDTQLFNPTRTAVKRLRASWWNANARHHGGHLRGSPGSGKEPGRLVLDAASTR